MFDNAAVEDVQLRELGYEPKLRRTLSTWQLTAFGLTYLQPIGPAVIFGYLLTSSGGSVALPYLFAFVGMIFTVQSYSILIKEYPLSGSIYNYVKCVVNPLFGFIAGWLLALDYILIPTITSVSSAIYAHQLVPIISYKFWLLIFVTSMGSLNLIGIRPTSYINNTILLVQIGVVVVGLIMWTYCLTKSSHALDVLISSSPFKFNSFSGLLQASSLAIFSFLGFDAVTTMAEESVNPRKDIPKAMMICTGIGFTIMFLTGYLGVLLVPNWKELAADQSWVNATLFEIAKKTGGDEFSLIYTLGFILAMVITNLVGTAAATRLLYGIGRDGIISKRFFSAVNNRFQTPHWNIIFIMIVEIFLGCFANTDQLAELINYGAISGFIILNASVMYLGYKQIVYDDNVRWNHSHYGSYFVLPFMGLIIMLLIFANMKTTTLVFGTFWGLIGIIYFQYRKKISHVS